MTPKSPLRVMIVDDHHGVRVALALTVKTAADLILVGEARDGQEAVALCAQCHPDVIVMDLVMPYMGGVTAIEQIHQQYPAIRIIAVSGFGSEAMLHKACQAGAAAYLTKDCAAADLLAAIRAVHFDPAGTHSD